MRIVNVKKEILPIKDGYLPTEIRSGFENIAKKVFCASFRPYVCEREDYGDYLLYNIEAYFFVNDEEMDHGVCKIQIKKKLNTEEDQYILIKYEQV